jgi:dihydrofolate reductase
MRGMSDVQAPQLILIAAVARNGVIGRAGGLAFNDPIDQRHFRQATLGSPVVMGRKTWESLPERFRPLPGRRNIVVSRNPMLVLRGAELAPSVEDALELAAADAPRVFVIGGAELYAQALPYADALLLTEIDADLEGDAVFPPWDRTLFKPGPSERHASGAGVPFTITTYRRQEP